MKLTDARPCIRCDGPLIKRGGSPTFYRLRISQGMINANAANGVLGLNQYFGGNAIALAEILAPAADDAIVFLEDKSKALGTEVFLCLDCMLIATEIGIWIDKQRERQKREDQAKAKDPA